MTAFGLTQTATSSSIMNEATYSSLSALMQSNNSEPLFSALPNINRLSINEPSSSMDENPYYHYCSPSNPFISNDPCSVSPSLPKDWLQLRPPCPYSSTSLVLGSSLSVSDGYKNSEYTQDWYLPPPQLSNQEWYPWCPPSPNPSFSHYHSFTPMDSPHSQPYLHTPLYDPQVHRDLLSTPIHFVGSWNQDDVKRSDLPCPTQNDEPDLFTWPEIKHTKENQFEETVGNECSEVGCLTLHGTIYGKRQQTAGSSMESSVGFSQGYSFSQDSTSTITGMDHSYFESTCSKFKDASSICSKEYIEAKAQIPYSSLMQTSVELPASTFGETASCLVDLPMLPTNLSASIPLNSGSDSLRILSSTLCDNFCNSGNPNMLSPSLLMGFLPVNSHESKNKAQILEGMDISSLNMEHRGTRHSAMEGPVEYQESSVVCTNSTVSSVSCPATIAKLNIALDSDAKQFSSATSGSWNDSSKNMSQSVVLPLTGTGMPLNDLSGLLESVSLSEKFGDSQRSVFPSNVGNNAFSTIKTDRLVGSVQNASTVMYDQFVPSTSILSSDCNLTTSTQLFPFFLSETSPVVLLPPFTEGSTRCDDVGPCQLFPFSLSETMPVVSTPFMERSTQYDDSGLCFYKDDGSDALFCGSYGTTKSCDLSGNMDGQHERMLNAAATKSLNTMIDFVTNGGSRCSPNISASDNVKEHISIDSRDNIPKISDENGAGSCIGGSDEYIQHSAVAVVTSLSESTKPRDGISGLSKSAACFPIDCHKIVQSIHNLSVVLLDSCFSGSDNVREPDLQVLQSVICNLSQYLVQRMGLSTSTIGPPLEPDQAGVSGKLRNTQKGSRLDGCYCNLKDDENFPVKDLNSYSEISDAGAKKIAAERTNPSQFPVEAVQSEKIDSVQQYPRIEKFSTSEQVKQSETDPGILLYKNPLAESAGVASTKFDTKCTKMGLETEREKHFGRGAPDCGIRNRETSESRAAVNSTSCLNVNLNMKGTGMDSVAPLFLWDKSYGVPEMKRNLNSITDGTLETDGNGTVRECSDMLLSQDRSDSESDLKSSLNSYDCNTLQSNVENETEQSEEIPAGFGVLQKCKGHFELKGREVSKPSDLPIHTLPVRYNDSSDAGVILVGKYVESDYSSHDLNLSHRRDSIEGKGRDTNQNSHQDSYGISQVNRLNKLPACTLAPPEVEHMLNLTLYTEDYSKSVGRGRIPSIRTMREVGDSSSKGKHLQSSPSIYSKFELSSSMSTDDSVINNTMKISDHEVKSAASVLGRILAKLIDVSANNSDMEREEDMGVEEEHKEFFFANSLDTQKSDSEERNIFTDTGGESNSLCQEDAANVEGLREYEIVTHQHDFEGATDAATARESSCSESEFSWEHL